MHGIFYDVVGGRSPIVLGSLAVTSGIQYTAKIEILRTDTSETGEHADVTIGGQNFGKCNPDGGDGDCSWYDCSNDLPNLKKVSSTAGVLPFEIKYSDDVDYESATCNINGVKTLGIVRITLTAHGNLIIS